MRLDDCVQVPLTDNSVLFLGRKIKNQIKDRVLKLDNL